MRAAPSGRETLAALAVYLCFAVILTLPALASPVPVFLGDTKTDLWKHVWGHWWVAGSIQQHLAWPLMTRLQSFPWGGTLFVIDPFNCLLSATVLAPFSRPTAFNLMVIVQLVFSAWAAWRLACHVTGDAAASLAAGTVFAFSAWQLSYSVASGVSETLGLACIPLTALFALRSIDAPGIKYPMLAGGALVLAGLNSWYLLLFSCLLTAILLLAAGLVGKPGSWLPRPDRSIWSRAFLALMFAFVGLFPMAVRFADSFDATTSLEPPVDQRVAFTTTMERQLDFFTLSDFFTPGKSNLRVVNVVERLMQTPYLGLLALLLAAWAVARKAPGALVWLAAGCLFMSLSLGPSVALTPDWQSVAAVNFPFLALHTVLGFWLITAPFRVHILTMLCLGMLVSLGVAQVGRARWVLGLLVAVGILAETCWLSPAPNPLPVARAAFPEIYRGIRLDQQSGILDLPPLRYETELCPGEYYYYQIAHGGGIPYATGGVYNPKLRDNGFFLAMWRLAVGIDPPATEPVSAGAGLEELAHLGYKHVILHGENLTPKTFTYCKSVIEKWLGPPAVTDGAMVRWSLTPACELRAGLARRAAK